MQQRTRNVEYSKLVLFSDNKYLNKEYHNDSNKESEYAKEAGGVI